MNPCVAILGGFFPPPCGVLRRRINMINMIKKSLKSIFRKFFFRKKERGGAGCGWWAARGRAPAAKIYHIYQFCPVWRSAHKKRVRGIGNRDTDKNGVRFLSDLSDAPRADRVPHQSECPVKRQAHFFVNDWCGERSLTPRRTAPKKTGPNTFVRQAKKRREAPTPQKRRGPSGPANLFSTGTAWTARP
jgi:hypothetical protein